jgi:hypothetical protein
MRIYDRNLTGTGAAESGRPQETQKLDRETASRAASVTGDRVELSTTLARLSQAISSFSSGRANKVQSLAAQYQSGNYRPDSLATSKGMVADALAAGAK